METINQISICYGLVIHAMKKKSQNT